VICFSLGKKEEGVCMTDRNYRLVMGLAILVILYFDLTHAMYGLIGLLFAEGITNWRIPLLVGRFTQQSDAPPMESFDFKWPINAERAWRLVVGAMLLLSAVIFNDTVWFLPWFLGIAIFGAGVSGICPLLFGLDFAGCRR
jgi:hypothetical protein